MDADGMSLLVGAGILGMIVGAALGIVAGDLARGCDAALYVAGAEGAPSTAAVLAPLCDQAALLRAAAFGLVALSGLVVGGALARDFLVSRRANA